MYLVHLFFIRAYPGLDSLFLSFLYHADGRFTDKFICNVGIRTADLWCRKRLLSQLLHNHCPSLVHLFFVSPFHPKTIKLLDASQSTSLNLPEQSLCHSMSIGIKLQLTAKLLKVFSPTCAWNLSYCRHWRAYSKKRGKVELHFSPDRDCDKNNLQWQVFDDWSVFISIVLTDSNVDMPW